MMRRMIGRYKGFRCAQMGEGVKGASARAHGGNGRGPLAFGRVKSPLAPVRIEMLNTSGSRRIIMENLVKATARSRRWYATTVENVLDRADVEGVKEAA